MKSSVVKLSTDEAELFLEFCKHHDTFQALVDSQVFETRNGQAILHFNPDGKLMEITRTVKVYRYAP